MTILVTGGAGYIGSITTLELQKKGHRVIVLDSLEQGDINRMQDFEHIQGKTSDRPLLDQVFSQYPIEAVVHFAAWIEAGESMQHPGKYFDNNTVGTLHLIEAMVHHGVKQLVFSSTAAVYGIPKRVPIQEGDTKDPVNAYGESKYLVERMLRWYDQIHGLKSMVIRYFNAAGALLDGSLGEAHEPETHLIPNVMKAAMTGQPIRLFGQDYPTPDGTCIRDYIHVLDLASAHIVTLDALTKGHPSNVYNAGTGKGYSNREVIQMVEAVSSKKIEVKVEPRRPGDPDQLIADSSRLQQELGWRPQYSDLRTIIESAWKWHSQKNLLATPQTKGA